MTYRVRTDLGHFVPRAGQVGEAVEHPEFDLSPFSVVLRFADGETRSYREREVERAGDDPMSATEALPHA